MFSSNFLQNVEYKLRVSHPKHLNGIMKVGSAADQKNEAEMTTGGVSDHYFLEGVRWPGHPSARCCPGASGAPLSYSDQLVLVFPKNGFALGWFRHNVVTVCQAPRWTLAVDTSGQCAVHSIPFPSLLRSRPV